MSIKRSTLKRLWAASGNTCAHPDCNEEVADVEQGIVVGEICHIRAQNPGGPRHDPDLSEKEIDEYGNLILLCPTHHTYIDKNSEDYSSERLEQWKEEQEENSKEVPDISEELLKKLLLSNLTIEGEIFSGGQSADLREYLVKQTDPKQNLPFVERESIPEELGQKHLIVGPKGSGKSRVVFERVMERFECEEVDSVFVPSSAVTRIEDIQGAFRYEYEGDVLLVWDDIHNIEPGERAEVFYETVLKIENHLSDDHSLHVIATVRSESQDQLPNYRYWKDDRVWASFNRSNLGVLSRSESNEVIEYAIDKYQLDITDGALDQFKTLVELESPTPFYIQAACTYLSKELDGRVMRADILDLPTYGEDIWTKQYREIAQKDSEARYVLLSIKLLRGITGALRVSVIRGIYMNVFDREPVDFDSALRRLEEQHWLTILGENPEVRIHSIQIEAIEDSVEPYFDQLAKYFRSDLAETEPELAVRLITNLSLELFIDPSITDESVIDESAKQIFEGGIGDNVDPETKAAFSNNYAGILTSRGETEKALKRTTETIQLLPKNPIGYINHQKIALQLKEKKIARNSLKRAVELAENFEDFDEQILRADFAKLLHKFGEDERAKEEFERAIEESEGDPRILQHYGEFLEGINQIGTARSFHQRAVEKSESVQILLQYARFLERYGPQDTFEEIQEEILRKTPESIDSVSDLSERDQAYKLQWTERGHNSPMITELPEYKLVEEAKNLSEERGPSYAAEWLETRLSEVPALPAIERLVKLYLNASKSETALRVFLEYFSKKSEEYPPVKLAEFAIETMYEFERSGYGEKAVELAKSASSHFSDGNESDRQANAMIMRQMANLDEFDSMDSLMLPYRLGKTHFFQGDLENAFNAFLDVWQHRDDLPEEDSEVGVEYGVQAGVCTLALVDIIRNWGGEIIGDGFDYDTIERFVRDNITASSEEFEELFAELQLQKGEENPVYSREELPKPQRMYPEQVDIDEEVVEYPDIKKEDLALTNTLRVYLQSDLEDIS